MKERVEQHVDANVFKYWKETSTFYVNEMFKIKLVQNEIKLDHIRLWRYL